MRAVLHRAGPLANLTVTLAAAYGCISLIGYVAFEQRTIFERATDIEKGKRAMLKHGMELTDYLGKKLEASWQTLSHIVFGAFIGGLVVLLILLNAGVPIVAGV